MTRLTRLLFIAILSVAGAPCAWADLVCWNVFNFEGESSISASIVTYATLNDMLLDTNATGGFVPNTFGVGKNIVGSGAVPVPAVPVPGAVLLGLFGLSVATAKLRKQT